MSGLAPVVTLVLPHTLRAAFILSLSLSHSPDSCRFPHGLLPRYRVIAIPPCLPRQCVTLSRGVSLVLVQVPGEVFLHKSGTIYCTTLTLKDSLYCVFYSVTHLLIRSLTRSLGLTLIPILLAVPVLVC